MVKCFDMEPLDATDAVAAGLFADVGSLEAGSVRLRLRSFSNCRSSAQAFYHFDILDSGTGAEVGDITFLPATGRRMPARSGIPEAD
jgi:hypothetical protein